MNQLQTVLDELIPLANAHFPDERSMLTDDDVKAANEAIAIVKQMMQVEPVAWIEWDLNLNEGDQDSICAGATKPDLCADGWDWMPLYTHPAPPAVPAGWVSLEDGMPEPYQMVLVARGPHITTGSYTPAFGWAWEEVDGEDEDSIATHWMPLPAAPKVAA
jgi:Protein of unknown function (DUF551)